MCRCSVVSQSVFPSELASPARSAPAATPPADTPSASSAGGSAKSENVKQAVRSGRWNRRWSTAIPPTIAPIPNADEISAQAPAPPSSCLATYAPRMKNTCPAMLARPEKTRIDHTQERDLTSRQPSCSSWKNGFVFGRSCAGRRSRARKTALTAKLAESTASAQPGLAAVTRMPASAGPATAPAAIASARRAFACCSRPGLITAGISPVDAGLKNAVAAP